MNPFGPSLNPLENEKSSSAFNQQNVGGNTQLSTDVLSQFRSVLDSNPSNLGLVDRSSSEFDLNLLVNGDFEIGSDFGGIQMDAEVTGWHAYPNSQGDQLLDVRNGKNGNQLRLDAVAGEHDRIYQDVYTTAGQTYLLNFDLLGENGSTLRSEEVRVFWDDEFVGAFRGLDRWQSVSVELSGPRDGFTRLEIREANENGTGGDGAGPFVDNFELLPVNRLNFENGSFELGPLNPDQRVYHISDIPNWSAGGPVDERQIRLRNSEFSSDGDYYWTLDSFENRFDRIRHTAATEAGKRYFFTFDMRSQLGTTDNGNQLRVRWNNAWADTHMATTIWQSHVVSIDNTITGTSRIDFAEAKTASEPNGDGDGPWIDNIRWYELDTAELDSTSILLSEGFEVATEESINVQMDDGGSRVTSVSFDVFSRFDTSDDQALSEDAFNVYVVSANDPGELLLDNGTEGGAIFSFRGDTIEFPAGQVGLSGSEVTIDVSAIASEISEFDLLFQLVNTDADDLTQFGISDITRNFDDGSSLAILRDNEPLAPGPGFDVGQLNETTEISSKLENIRIDSQSGSYLAELSIVNKGGNAGRNVAVVFDELPSGVQILNASGTTDDGRSYINMRPAISSGGLASGLESDFVLLEIESPNLDQFRLKATIFKGLPNRPPEFPAIPDVTMLPGGFQRIDFNASDADGDPVTYRLVPADEMPTIVFNANGYMEIKPAPGQEGSYAFEIEATDSASVVRQPVSVLVEADPITTTRISGTILDTNQDPLAGIPVELDTIQTTTDQDGNFVIEFDGVAPSDTLVIRGEEFVGPEAYPYIAEKLHLLFGRELYPNVDNVVNRPIYLPALDLAQADPYDPANTNPTVIDAVLRSGEAPAELTVAPGTLKDQSGNDFTGLMHITEVPRDLTPAALPPGLLPDVVVTIQPAELAFDEPAPITLPNRAGYAPGTPLDLWSIDPAVGDFDIVGEMRVSADGTVIETISGGIRNSSWHAPVPPPPFNLDDATKDPTNAGADTIAASSEFELFSGARTEVHDLASYQSQGVTRGVSLVYDSLRANPVHLTRFTIDEVQDWVIGNTSFGLDGRLIAEMAYEYDGVTYQIPGNLPDSPYHHWSLENAQSTELAVFGAIMVDATELRTGLVPYALRAGFGLAIGNGIVGGGVTETANDAFVNINYRGSAFGNGWGVSGLQTLHVANYINGGQYAEAVMIVDGNGEELVFTRFLKDGSGGGYFAYRSPAGDFSTLTLEQDGTFKRTLPDQSVYHFDSQNRLSRVVDRNNNVTQYIYENGRISKIIDPVMLETTFTYESQRVIIESPDGRRNILHLDAEGNLVEVVNADRTSKKYGYDNNFLMTTETDERGNTTVLEYDLLGRLVKATHPDREFSEYQSAESRIAELAGVDGDTNDLPSAPLKEDLLKALAISENRNVEEYAINDAGRTLEKRDSIGRLFSFFRDSNQLITKQIDANGNVTAYEYDDFGNPVVVEDVTMPQGTITPDLGAPIAGDGVAVGDINNDGLDDFVTTTAIVLATANSGFENLGPNQLLNDARGVRLLDFNNDGNLDIVTENTDTVVVALGNGDGSFVESDSLMVSSGSVYNLRTADLNGDGNLDIAFNSNSGDLNMMIGDGVGQFQLTTIANIEIGTFEFGDINSDQIIDIVSFSQLGSTRLTFWLGDGNLGFMQFGFSGDIGEWPWVLRLGDVNNDQQLDVLIANEADASVSVLAGNGNGTFGASQQYFTHIAPDVFEVRDVDGDGNTDLVTIDSSVQGLAYLKGDGAGSFEFQDQFFVPEGTQIDFGDFNQDGIDDLVTNEGEILLGDDQNGFASLSVNQEAIYHELLSRNIYAFPGETSSFEFDADNDGDDDFIVAGSFLSNSTGIRFAYLVTKLRENDGSFTIRQNLDFSNVRFPEAEHDDVNNDGIEDLVVIERNGSFPANPRITVFEGLVGGGFQRGNSYSLPSEGRLDLEDLNNDGDTDVLFYRSSSATVFLSQGDGTFVEQGSFTYGSAGVSLGVIPKPAVIDLNADNAVDLVFTKARDDEVAIHLGNGDGTFQDESRFLAGDNPFQIISGDIDGDSFGDVIVANTRSSDLTYFRGDGNGNLVDAKYVFLGDSPRNIALGDIDLDGDLDLVADTVGEVFIATNDNGNFNSVREFDSNATGELKIGDFTGDGQPDVKLKHVQALETSFSVIGGTGDGSLNSRERRHSLIQFDPAFSQFRSTADRLGLRTQYTIDDTNGNILTASYGDNTEVKYTYTPSGQVETILDQERRLTRNEYDDLGRLIKTTFAVGTPDEASQRFDYDAAGNQDLFVDENGHELISVFDEMNRLVETEDHLGNKTIFDYDRAGNLIVTTDAKMVSTTNTYDKRNRLKEVINDNGNTTTYKYDAESNLRFLTDPNGFVTENEYDDRNRLELTRDPENGITKFEYDDNGNMTMLTDPELNRTRFEYDDQDRLTREIDPLNKSTSYRYDANGNLVRKVDRNNRTSDFYYDKRDRLIEEVWSGGAVDNTIAYAYDDVGNLRIVEDAFSQLIYMYDDRDRVLSVRSQGAADAPVSLLEYTYDDVGNVLTVVDTINGESGALTEYQYDELNRVELISQSDHDPSNADAISEKSVVFAYNAIDQYTSLSRYSDLTHQNLVAVTTYEYDELNRLKSLNHGTENEPRNFSYYKYDYDPASRINQITDVHGLTTYSYDATDQILSAQRAAGDGRDDESYAYDRNGNRTNSHRHGSGYATETGNRTANDGIYRYEYDNEGNMIRRTVENESDGTGPVGSYRVFTWDHRNRLVLSEDFDQGGGIIQSVLNNYDVSIGRRISQRIERHGSTEIDSSFTSYIYDRENVIADSQFDGASAQQITTRYLWGGTVDELLAQQNRNDPNPTIWVLGDHLKSIRQGVDKSRQVRGVFDFDSFGNLVQTSSSSFETRYLYTGREFDQSTGLYYYRARFYDAAIGVFLSEDPIGVSPENKSLYAYTRNSPMTNIDPYGLTPWPVVADEISDFLTNEYLAAYGRRRTTHPHESEFESMQHAGFEVYGESARRFDPAEIKKAIIEQQDAIEAFKNKSLSDKRKDVLDKFSPSREDVLNTLEFLTDDLIDIVESLFPGTISNDWLDWKNRKAEERERNRQPTPFFDE